jgi:hypothetical protein
MAVLVALQKSTYDAWVTAELFEHVEHAYHLNKFGQLDLPNSKCKEVVTTCTTGHLWGINPSQSVCNYVI